MTTKEINKAFEALDHVFYSAWTNYADKLFRECLIEEKEHRGFAPEFKGHHTADTISPSQAARLFAVKRVAEYLNGEKFPVGQQFLHMQTSCFLAAGIVDEFGDRVREAWKDFDLAELAALNYTDFVKVNKVAA